MLKLVNGTMKSTEVVEQLNIFRRLEGVNDKLHKHFMESVRFEFEEEIRSDEVSTHLYKDEQGKERPCYLLTTDQAKIMLMKESKTVRKAMVKYINGLERELEALRVPQSYAEALIEAGKLALELEKEKEKTENLENYSSGVLAYANRVTANNRQLAKEEHCISVTQFGAKFGFSGKVVNEILLEVSLIRKMKHNKNYRYVANTKKEWFFESANKYKTLLITPSGVIGLEKALKNKGYIYE